MTPGFWALLAVVAVAVIGIGIFIVVRKARPKAPSAGYDRTSPSRAANGHTYRADGTAWRCAICGNHVPRREGVSRAGRGRPRRPPPRRSGRTSSGLRSWVRASPRRARVCEPGTRHTRVLPPRCPVWRSMARSSLTTKPAPASTPFEDGDWPGLRHIYPPRWCSAVTASPRVSFSPSSCSSSWHQPSRTSCSPKPSVPGLRIPHPACRWKT